MISILAKYTGRSSNLGYQTGKTYGLYLETYSWWDRLFNGVAFTIRPIYKQAGDTPKPCPYHSFETFLKYWTDIQRLEENLI